MEKWGARLYGCQECQSVCPWNSRVTPAGPPAAVEPGPSASIRQLLALDAAALKSRFRGMAMGMSWIPGEALLRNALIAAGNSAEPTLKSDVARFLSCGNAVLEHTARWALEKLSRS
jgi:epoxyqueuosine reductase